MNKTKSREIQNAAIVIALLMDKLELEELEVSDAELTNVGGGLIDHRCDKCSALKIWRTRPKEESKS